MLVLCTRAIAFAAVAQFSSPRGVCGEKKAVVATVVLVRSASAQLAPYCTIHPYCISPYEVLVHPAMGFCINHHRNCCSAATATASANPPASFVGGTGARQRLFCRRREVSMTS